MTKLLILTGLASCLTLQSHAWVPKTLSHDDLDMLNKKEVISIPRVVGGKCQFESGKIAEYLHITWKDFDTAVGNFIQDNQENPNFTKDTNIQANRVDCDLCDKSSDLAYAEYQLGVENTKQTRNDRWRFRVGCIKSKQ